jgi:AcrR family transcriptional regulator
MAETDSFEALKNPEGTRAQILNAAMICIMTLGPARTNISNIASQASVSRPTVYAHFESLEDIVKEAIANGIKILVKSLEAYAADYQTPQERISETFLHLLDLSDEVDVLRKPMSFEVPASEREMIPGEAIEAARGVVDKLVGDDLANKDLSAANERAETAVRFFLSLAAFRRADDVRGYIERVVLPCKDPQPPAVKPIRACNIHNVKAP